MNNALLLDTHIALWLDEAHERLRPPTAALIEACRRDGGVIFFSAVSVWEIALLLDTNRLTLNTPLDDWVDQFIRNAGIEMLPLDHRAASRAYDLSDLPYRDPADRFLIATAIGQGCPLVTYDARILQFANRHGRRYGFTAVS
ncbi:MAG TPA: type II toxin-antitoxin system VapC family toxin [Stellaceae bacterium]